MYKRQFSCEHFRRSTNSLPQIPCRIFTTTIIDHFHWWPMNRRGNNTWSISSHSSNRPIGPGQSPSSMKVEITSQKWRSRRRCLMPRTIINQ